MTRRPSSSTVHEPHWPWSQPFLGAVTPSRSRSASSSVMRLSTVRSRRMPSTSRVSSLWWRSGWLTVAGYPGWWWPNVAGQCLLVCGVASTAAIPVVNGTDSARAMPPTAERAISMATLSPVSTSASDRLATLNNSSSGSALPA